jgi:uncharacterized protein involved in type VI secretion and phage assembly
MQITNLASFFFHQIREAEQEADRVYEPVIGIVTDNKDPEKLMRVKVKIPALSSEDTTFWIPVVSLGAGKDRGWFFLPEVNDEVLVAFEHGDMNRPVVIGALWNGEDSPPEEQSSSNPKRVIVSRSGSRIELDDEGGSITISDGGGNGELIFNAGDNSLTIEAKQGDVIVMAPAGELQVQVDGDIQMSADVNFDVRGGSNANLGADGGATLKASAVVMIQGGTLDVNPGGTSEPAAASTSPEDVADPLGG